MSLYIKSWKETWKIRWW